MLSFLLFIVATILFIVAAIAAIGRDRHSGSWLLAAAGLACMAGGFALERWPG